jgi:hypothetical protein
MPILVQFLFFQMVLMSGIFDRMLLTAEKKAIRAKDRQPYHLLSSRLGVASLFPGTCVRNPRVVRRHPYPLSADEQFAESRDRESNSKDVQQVHQLLPR